MAGVSLESGALHEFTFYPTLGAEFQPELQGAFLIGADGVPVRGELHLRDGAITCESRNSEALGLSLLWPVAGCGTLQVETTRLPSREDPYHLHVELARHRLMRISFKREEWGLFDYPGLDEVAAAIDRARDLFVAALQHADDPPRAAELADQSLALSVSASEQLARFHASVFIARRQQSGGLPRGFLGAGLPARPSAAESLERAKSALDFVRVPFCWREIQPTEHEAGYDEVDGLLRALSKTSLGVRGGPLLNFGVSWVPDWMYIWENDYDAIADFAKEHVRRTVKRYAGKIHNWIVASGLHADSVFPFTFEQIIDLTRMAAGIARQTSARAQVVLELTQPWGEYYARNQRSIPPLLYAEMAVQSGIAFDALGVRLLFGLAAEGFHARDFFQVSSLLDRLANLGKPVHVTAAAVPSQPSGGSPVDALRAGGAWRDGWSEAVQADWLGELVETALSKPYVESVSLQQIADGGDDAVPSGGILRADLSAKPGLKRLTDLRKRCQAAEAKR